MDARHCIEDSVVVDKFKNKRGINECFAVFWPDRRLSYSLP